MDTGALRDVDELRDESDEHQPVRLVLDLRTSAVDTDSLVEELIPGTELEHTVRVNFNVLGLNDRPKVSGFGELLAEWLDFRRETVRRRTRYRLGRIAARLKTIDALRKAHAKLEVLVRILKEEDEPKPAITAALEVDDKQADTILGTRVRNLAKLEDAKLAREATELTAEQAELEALSRRSGKARRHDRRRTRRNHRAPTRPRGGPGSRPERRTSAGPGPPRPTSSTRR